jgi:hypothetical protein
LLPGPASGGTRHSKRPGMAGARGNIRFDHRCPGWVECAGRPGPLQAHAGGARSRLSPTTARTGAAGEKQQSRRVECAIGTGALRDSEKRQCSVAATPRNGTTDETRRHGRDQTSFLLLSSSVSSMVPGPITMVDQKARRCWRTRSRSRRIGRHPQLRRCAALATLPFPAPGVVEPRSFSPTLPVKHARCGGTCCQIKSCAMWRRPRGNSVWGTGSWACRAGPAAKSSRRCSRAVAALRRAGDLAVTRARGCRTGAVSPTLPAACWCRG